MKKIKACMTSNTNEWYTPKDLFDTLNNEFNFTLDPCCTEFSKKCEKYFTIEDDGLKQNWGGYNVFMNPPYGREIKDWIQKAYNESKKENTIVVALIPARTDTSYWHDYIFNKAKDIRFLRGRVKFENINGIVESSAPFPSAIVVF